MSIEEHVALAPYTTFKIGGNARYFCSVHTEDELVEAVSFAQKNSLRTLIMGGGSNMLVSDKGFDGLVINMNIKGITVMGETISVQAGEVWDEFVFYAVSNAMYGFENLSAIPGTVGAAPVQNIGAYGTEVAEVIQAVRVFDVSSMKFIELSNKECAFAYRDSLFKHHKGRYIITRVDFVCRKNGAVNIEYKDLKQYFLDHPHTNPSISDVRNAVIEIRANKLPDWKHWGTAGSFFKNPIVPQQKYDELKKTYPDLPGFPGADGTVKIPLGWILDKICNVKGLKRGRVSTYEKQALVLVSEFGATAQEVMDLAHELMACVKEKTGIEIEGEVEWVN